MKVFARRVKSLAHEAGRFVVEIGFLHYERQNSSHALAPFCRWPQTFALSHALLPCNTKGAKGNSPIRKGCVRDPQNTELEVQLCVRGSLYKIEMPHWTVAQLVERVAVNRVVAGSSPAFPANTTAPGAPLHKGNARQTRGIRGSADAPITARWLAVPHRKEPNLSATLDIVASARALPGI
jgi:hypothetical protein